MLTNSKNSVPSNTRWHKHTEYHDSGVAWLNSVPSHWDIAPLFTQFRERKTLNRGNIESNVLSLSYGKIIRRDVADNFGLLPESFETYQIVDEGDLVLRLTDLQNDQRSLRVGAVHERGIITSAYLGLRNLGQYQSQYAYYLLHAYDLLKVFYGFGGGVRQSMRYEDVKRIPLLVPPFDEQRAIAAFLDRETATIDTLIAKKRELIERLQEKRTALISHAVTKGLDPTVAMRDSGVEWLGKIPAHWELSRLKFAASHIVDCPHSTPEYSQDGIYFVIRTADIQPGHLSVLDAKKVEYPEYEKRIFRLKPLPNDIFYSREGERYGIAALVPAKDPVCLGQRMMHFRSGRDFDARYLMWHLNAKGVYAQAEQDVLGATSPHVNVSTIVNFQIANPPRHEQQAIADYIDNESQKMSELQEKMQDAIDRLQEYRTALISAAVTGKIDVRNYGKGEA
ncbi:MAG: restriction endonuclease subunit S [Caldilineaceae bacterium]